jgi:hypothetical protein
MTIDKLYKEVTTALDQRNIPYMVSGSMAMLAYTMGRSTRDIDIVIELSEDALDQFFEIFGSHFYLRKQVATEEIRNRGMFNVIDHRSGMKIDFVVKKNSAYRKEEFGRRQNRILFGHSAWIVSVEDLILSKLIWIQDVQSNRQMEDIRELLAYTHLDMTYLKKWITELRLATFDLL